MKRSKTNYVNWYCLSTLLPYGIRSLLLFAAFYLILMQLPTRSRAQDGLPQSELTAGQMESSSAIKQTLDGPFPGLLLTVQDHAPIADGRYRHLYRAACCVYTAKKSSDRFGAVMLYSRRFVVHAPDAEALPLAKRTARMLLLLHGEMLSHLRTDHPGRYQTVSVWLTRRLERGLSPDTAGEQFKDQIYIYDLFSPRRPIEWARELAHEYGHFALVPGASGFTSPEDDADGVLGERMFLKWLWADVRSARIKPDILPFLTQDQLDTYIALQVAPLMRRAARDGLDVRQLAKKDAEGMDYLVGILLYLDSLYGSRQFQDIRACTMPGKVGDFLHSQDYVRGLSRSLAEATELTLHPNDFAFGKNSSTATVYLPRGTYAFSATGSLLAWEWADSALHIQNQALVTIPQPGWHKIVFTLGDAPDPLPALHMYRTTK